MKKITVDFNRTFEEEILKNTLGLAENSYAVARVPEAKEKLSRLAEYGIDDPLLLSTLLVSELGLEYAAEFLSPKIMATLEAVDDTDDTYVRYFGLHDLDKMMSAENPYVCAVFLARNILELTDEKAMAGYAAMDDTDRYEILRDMAYENAEISEKILERKTWEKVSFIGVYTDVLDELADRLPKSAAVRMLKYYAGEIRKNLTEANIVLPEIGDDLRQMPPKAGNRYKI